MMILRRIVGTWLRGWSDLIRHGSIPGYAEKTWLERKRIDRSAIRRLLAMPGFRCAILLVAAAQILALSLTWEWDLAGWRRDILRAAPGLFVLPWLATARRHAIESTLRDIDL